MKNTQILAAVLLAVGATTAHAAPYVEVGYAVPEFSGAGISGSFGAVRSIVGMGFNDNLDGEFMVATGVVDSMIGVTTLSLDHMYGLYLKPKTKLSDTIELFGRIGYVNTQVSASNWAASTWASDSSASYGIGVQFNINKGTAITTDWTSYYNKSGTTLDGFSVNLKLDF
jgi:hypothetical protein